MTRLFLITFFLGQVFSTDAAQIKIQKPDGQIIISKSLTRKQLHKTLGQLTEELLIENKIFARIDIFNGLRIFQTIDQWSPKQIVKDNGAEILAQGWCYTINNHLLEKMADEVKLRKDDVALWYYGQALFRDGKWLADCEMVK